MLQELLSKISRPTIDDIPEIEDIARQYTDNPLPDKFAAAAVVKKFDDVTAFGVLRNNVEALLYVSGDMREKVEALKLLIQQAKIDARSMGYEDIYVFAQDSKFADILIKHFGFRKAKGVPLILDL